MKDVKSKKERGKKNYLLLLAVLLVSGFFVTNTTRVKINLEASILKIC